MTIVIWFWLLHETFSGLGANVIFLKSKYEIGLVETNHWGKGNSY